MEYENPDIISLPKRCKSKFTPEEDQMIQDLVKKFGDQNWALIASMMKGRSTRQCRERYINYLNPTINRSPWTQAEDDLLYEKKAIYGTHWKSIADFFPHRTDINVKNRWLKLQRQKAKKIRKEEKITTKHKNVLDAGDCWVNFVEPIYNSLEFCEVENMSEDMLRYISIMDC